MLDAFTAEAAQRGAVLDRTATVSLLRSGQDKLRIFGPLSFVGLLVPHAVRLLAGADQRTLIGWSIACGPVLLLAADVAGRVLVRPAELEAGVVTAFVGAPVLLLLAVRRER